MSTISATLTDDHHHCDDLFAAAENAVNDGRWDEAREGFARFRTATERHFEMEEKVLFPAFEDMTGMTQGPTQVMRMEHAQMRDVFADMAQAVESGDRDGYLGQSETLLMLMQQHNLKEEQILYRMADQALQAQSAQILEQMRAMAGAG